MAAIVKWSWVALCVFNLVVMVAMVGKPRGTLTAGRAAVSLLVSGAIVVAVILTWDTSQ